MSTCKFLKVEWVGWTLMDRRVHAESEEKVQKYVHDVVNALSQVIIQILVTGGGDAKEGGTGEVVSRS